MTNSPESSALQLVQENIARAGAASTQSAQKDSHSDQAEFQRTFFLNECAILHDEINARMAQRGNLFTFTIITAGSLLSLGATTSPQIALFYPVLSLFLAAAWSDEDGKIGALGAYLHDQEVRHKLDGWTSYHRRRQKTPRAFLAGLQHFYPKSLLSLATRGVFLSTQLLAILVGLSQTRPFNVAGKVDLLSILPLLCIAVAATLITAFLIRHKRDHTLEREQQDS